MTDPLECSPLLSQPRRTEAEALAGVRPEDCAEARRRACIKRRDFCLPRAVYGPGACPGCHKESANASLD